MLGAAAAPPGKYVSPGGSDGNPGTSPDQPFKTVAYAVKQLNPGDTLYVMEGEFFENERGDSSVVVDRSGLPDAWITITAQPGATPILRSNQSNGIKVEGASYIEVSNLELVGNPTGGTSSYSGAGINVDSIYGPAKNHHVRILNNRISGFGAGGVPVTGSSHVEVRDNVIHNVAEVEPTQHSGISILESFNMGFGDDSNGYSNYITGNVVYQVENKNRDNLGRFTDGNCIIMDRTNINNYSGRTLIANNLCIDNGGRGIQIFESKHVDVVNNTIYQNLKTPEIASSGGELGSFYSSDVEFANNLVFARNGLKPARSFDSSNIRFVKNLYVADTAPEYNGASNDDRRVAPGTPVVSSPSTNPNPTNFELKTGSPAVDAGTNKFNSVMARDVTGAARVAGEAVDLGALESSSSAPAPTTQAPAAAAPAQTTQAPAAQRLRPRRPRLRRQRHRPRRPRLRRQRHRPRRPRLRRQRRRPQRPRLRPRPPCPRPRTVRPLKPPETTTPRLRSATSLAAHQAKQELWPRHLPPPGTPVPQPTHSRWEGRARPMVPVIAAQGLDLP